MIRRNHAPVALLAFLVAGFLAMVVSPARAGVTTRVSVASDGAQGNDWSRYPSISADGRYVAFDSLASNLVPGDTNGWEDVFVHDRLTGQTTRVSVASDGTQADSWGSHPSTSADGRYVAFESEASNLVPADTNRSRDIFVHDRLTGQTTRVSVASDGTQGNARSLWASISADGRYVAFMSEASNLAPGDTNMEWDILVHDRLTGQTTRVSVASDGTQGNDDSSSPSISADGRHVAFGSPASNLVPGDTNECWDTFVHDRLTGQTTRVSLASDGTQGNDHSWRPSISAEGRHVAFHSYASNLVPGDTNRWSDMFVHDRLTGQTTRVSLASDGNQGNDDSWLPSISAEGRHVPFHSFASNLVPADTNAWSDIFVHDRETGQTTRVSVASDGTQGNGHSWWPSISAEGRHVAFESWASNLVPADTNRDKDIFVHDRGPTCDITYTPASPTTDDIITFDSGAADGDGALVSVEWDFGDGATMFGDPVNHQYAMPGTYAVIVTVCDNDGYCTDCTASVEVWCLCDVAIARTHCKMPAAGHVGQCKRGEIGARNRSLTESCDVVLRVTDNAGNVVFETTETIGPGRRIRVRFEHCYTADEVGRNVWAWEVWPVECSELTPWDNVHLRKVNVQPGVRASVRNWLPLWRLWRR